MPPFVNHGRLSLTKALGSIRSEILISHLILLIHIHQHLCCPDHAVTVQIRCFSIFFKESISKLIGYSKKQILEISVKIKSSLYQFSSSRIVSFLATSRNSSQVVGISSSVSPAASH